MSQEISIKVNIADIAYPLKIKIEDEENVRNAARLINDKVKSFREDYHVTDKVNILSAVSLSLACELMKYQTSEWVEDNGVTEGIKGLNETLESFLHSAH